MEEKAITKERIKATPAVHEIEHTDSELYKVGIYTTAAFAVGAGVWGIICLSSSVFAGGGPVEMLKNLYQAIVGL
ncbi:MAG: hypothetical protein KKD01_03080 [Proteobacteria bacterium]|nr:hypothetical protein [Pseudomonadota bacterium]MBU1234617.1 hypothetical protein [Pseudomonadota bacterium]MBU1416990.1 hypothetical protein [Pseudomonadota bacterium]MBU1453686.1 hypothetical protein [Pseudomonadota bacterium]